MRIILEWCDKSWKSTLCKFLQENLPGFSYQKFSAPKWNAYDEYIDFTVSTMSKNYICDRFWIWEQVYWPIYRGKCMTPEEVDTLDNLCSLNWDIIIYCQTSIEQTKLNFVKDWEEVTKEQHIPEIHRLFIDTISDLQTSVIMYDYRLQNMNTIYNIIKSFLINN